MQILQSRVCYVQYKGYQGTRAKGLVKLNISLTALYFKAKIIPPADRNSTGGFIQPSEAFLQAGCWIRRDQHRSH